ncbi:ATP-binding cassette domain-containing protein [Gordonia sp. HNM0687]|uniref:ATP-binding cassette domain-containing protein n=1 Tax=Gordonia mangrovi TaxID=2665643 RepID=A0A6L7GV50_9ACTN|nr:sugar ABC transporter ATP-binding protein [Gordonia mangrovi]MXP23453.1 ATP-binding cassette domain-containing protein [Gordonia mangrovi]UVF76651.1 sugar ABC transporter ATP-binding protein [Gordonia mangrovi]
MSDRMREADGSDADTTELIQLASITKQFGSQKALDGVDLEIRAGEVHALVGENGAGKSTLGKVISGFHLPDSGRMTVAGKPVSYRSPSAALHDGIVTMHQEISLALDCTVIDNVLLGREQHRFGYVAKRRNLEIFDELVERTGFELDPNATAGDLGLPAQQEVEIMRAIARDARLIIMDEPTAALPGEAAAKLHKVVRRLRDSGTSIVYISHFLDEVLDLSDRVSVLRNGRHVRTRDASDYTHTSLISDMLGRSLEANYPEKPAVPANARVILDAKQVRVPGASGPVDVTVRAGEVLGIFGLVGSGRSELAHALFGATKGVEADITLDESPYQPRSPRYALDSGISLLPESRKTEGLFLGLNQRHNVSSAFLKDVSTAGVVNRKREADLTRDALTDMGVDNVDLTADVMRLSGGNQQKVLFGKCLFRTPKLLILDEPTRGVDVGSRRAIYDRVVEFVRSGMAVIVISSELDEVTHLCHRLVVMRGGEIVGSFDPDSADHDKVLQTAFGASEPELADSAPHTKAR